MGHRQSGPSLSPCSSSQLAWCHAWPSAGPQHYGNGAWGIEPSVPPGGWEGQGLPSLPCLCQLFCLTAFERERSLLPSLCPVCEHVYKSATHTYTYIVHRHLVHMGGNPSSKEGGSTRACGCSQPTFTNSTASIDPPPLSQQVFSPRYSYLLGQDVEVRLEGQSRLEPVTIFLNEVEVNSTHQFLVLIKNVSLESIRWDFIISRSIKSMLDSRGVKLS